jgi:hypothetical protein
MKVNVGGTLKPVVSAKVNIGGVLKAVASVKINVGGVLKAGDIFTPPGGGGFSASASDYAPYGSRTGPGFVTTTSVTITPTGGHSPYTYLWTKTAGSGSITTATSASTTFGASVAPGDDEVGAFQCVVTDALSQTVTVSGIEATFIAF